MRASTALLGLVLAVSAAHGQYVEATILLPDSVSALAGVGSVVFHSSTNTIYLGGSDSYLVAVDARTNAKLRRMTVGDGPHVLASVPTGNKVYCANDDATVAVVDAATNLPTKTFAMQRRVTDLVFNERENRLYCGNADDDVVRVIDCTADTIVARITVGSGPGALCYSPQLNRIYCAHKDLDEVTVIDCAADTVLSTVWVCGVEPVDICYDSATNSVYTANQGSSTVSEIDCASDTLLRVVSVGRGAGAIVNGPPGKVYCSDYGDSSLSVITESGVKTVRTVQYPGALSYDPVNQKVYCCAGESYTGVTVLDAVGDTVVAQPEVAGPTTLCWNPAGNGTYVLSSSDDCISVVDGVSDAVQDTIVFVVVSPGSLCYSTTSNHLYCLDQGHDLLYVIDGESNQVLRSIETGGHADDLLWNPASNKLYLNYRSADTVGIIDCVRDSIVAKVPTGDQPRDLCCTDEGKVYVANVYDGVTVIDGQGDSVCAFVPVSGEPRTLCYDRTDEKVYVGKSHGSDISVIDVVSDSLVATVSVPYMSGVDLCWNPNYDKLYVAGWGYDSLIVVDCTRDRILRQICVYATLSGLYNDSVCDKVYGLDTWKGSLHIVSAAFDTAHHSLGIGSGSAILDNGKQGPANRVYCADYDADGVSVVGAYKMDSVLRRINVGSGPSDLAWNPAYSRVYVSNYGSSSISVIRDTIGVGLEEGRLQSSGGKPQATVVRGVLELGPGGRQNAGYRAELLDAAGRKVLDLKPGANDVQALAPGVYFVRQASSVMHQASSVTKVVLTE